MAGIDACSTGKAYKQTVLLVEDEPSILKIHKIFLERIGLAVDTAITGAEAFNKFQNYHYPLIILDGSVPDTNGKELGLCIREYERASGRPRTPLILLSAFTEELIKEWCEAADIDAYAIKPVHPVDLKKLILQYLTLRDISKTL